MNTKTISLQEANLISWFNGQISVLEQQSGKRVEKLLLSVDRSESNDISISLTLVDKTPPTASPTTATYPVEAPPAV